MSKNNEFDFDLTPEYEEEKANNNDNFGAEEDKVEWVKPKKDWVKIVSYCGAGTIFVALLILLVAKSCNDNNQEENLRAWQNAYNSMKDNRDRLFNDSIDNAERNDTLMGKLAYYETELGKAQDSLVAYKDSLKLLNQKLEDCSKPKKVYSKKKTTPLKKKTPSAIDTLRYPSLRNKTKAENTVIINGDNNNVVINQKDNSVKKENDTIRINIKKTINFKYSIKTR